MISQQDIAKLLPGLAVLWGVGVGQGEAPVFLDRMKIWVFKCKDTNKWENHKSEESSGEV